MRRVWVSALSCALGCLGPQVSDARDPANVFGDPDITPAAAPHVEDDPEYFPQLPFFGQRIEYLQGFADGQPIRYFNVDGQQSDIIAPLYFIVGSDGQQLGLPVMDVLPGQPGYTPWWRRIVVRTTDTYAGQRIWSRAAIDEGVRLGILRAPEPTTTVLDCPVVLRGTVSVVEPPPSTRTASASTAWYRNKRVQLVQFTGTTQVPIESNTMPHFPVYILQRIDQPSPLYEFVTRVDITGDGRLDASNNVFAGGLTSSRYSPLWRAYLVRVASDVRSIDTARSATVAELTRESDLAELSSGMLRPASGRILSITPLDGPLVNCPIQRVVGER